MDNCSFFIKNNALFGGFPTQENVDELEKNGVRYFVNLTEKNEPKINPYKTPTSIMTLDRVEASRYSAGVLAL